MEPILGKYKRILSRLIMSLVVVFFCIFLFKCVGNVIQDHKVRRTGKVEGARFEQVYEQPGMDLEIIIDKKTGQHYLIKDRAISKMSYGSTMVEIDE